MVYYGALADLVIILHLLFILFALLGGLLALWHRWVLAIHLPAAIWACAIEFVGWICPLTPLENWLREASGSGGYRDGFIEHYLIPLIYPVTLTPQLQILLGVVVIVTNLMVYSWVIYRWRKLRSDR